MADVCDSDTSYLRKLFLRHAFHFSHFSDLRTDHLLVYHVQASPCAVVLVL